MNVAALEKKGNSKSVFRLFLKNLRRDKLALVGVFC